MHSANESANQGNYNRKSQAYSYLWCHLVTQHESWPLVKPIAMDMPAISSRLTEVKGVAANIQRGFTQRLRRFSQPQRLRVGVHVPLREFLSEFRRNIFCGVECTR